MISRLGRMEPRWRHGILAVRVPPAKASVAVSLCGRHIRDSVLGVGPVHESDVSKNTYLIYNKYVNFTLFASAMLAADAMEEPYRIRSVSSRCRNVPG